MHACSICMFSYTPEARAFQSSLHVYGCAHLCVHVVCVKYVGCMGLVVHPLVAYEI
jgi:hypothetical protein